MSGSANQCQLQPRKEADKVGLRAASMQKSIEGSVFRLLGSVDELRLIVDVLEVDDAFAFASVCRTFRDVTCQSGSTAARFPRGVRTSVLGACAGSILNRSIERRLNP